MDFQSAIVESNEIVGPGYSLVRFRGERPLLGRPGQFVMVRGDWGTAPLLPRAFSVVDYGPTASILVREVGEGTRRLVALRPGDELTVGGPLGHGFSDDAPGLPVLVAGGVGVAPVLCQAEHLARLGRKPVFLYGARTGPDLLLLERIAKVAELRLATEDGSRGVRGRVTDLIATLLDEIPDVALYACGPEGMLEAVARTAVARTLPCQIALESPMACGRGTCRGCAVLAASGNYRYVCSDGPVFPAAEIYGGAP